MDNVTVLGQFLAVAIGLTLSVVCVLIHYEALGRLTTWVPRFVSARRQGVLVIILALLVVHQIEAWVFSFGYVTAVWSGIMGELAGADGGFFTYAYFSIITFTTLGFGDIVPVGPIRFIASVEALTGFVLITWSASFTYLQMETRWKHK